MVAVNLTGEIVPSSLKTSIFEHEKVGFDADSIKHSLSNCLTYSVGKDPITATDRDTFVAAAYLVRNRMIDRWMETMRSYYINDAKRVYYFSLEFLMGRTLMNSVHNLGFDQQFRKACEESGIILDDVREIEPDAALGNGGLGRLAACFLDSMATLDLPGFGYGINYEFGLFKQSFINGFQHERPDHWLEGGSPWLIEHNDEAVIVPAYGSLAPTTERR